MRPIRVNPPADLPVTLDEAKAHLRVMHNAEDALIENLIATAVDHLDGYRGILGRCIISQEWRVAASSVARTMRLPFPDVSEAAITYLDASGAEQTATGFQLVEGDSGTQISFPGGVDIPSVSREASAPVTITFTSGYGTAADVPASIKAAILLHVGTLYENRESLTENTNSNRAYEALIAPHRWVGF